MLLPAGALAGWLVRASVVVYESLAVGLQASTDLSLLSTFFLYCFDPLLFLLLCNKC